jgi:hypothetical protein
LTVGDIVNISMTGVNSYQPASGIEIIVLMNFSGSVTMYYGHTDGVQDTAQFFAGSASTPNYINPVLGNKSGFTNARYYYNTSAHALKGFSGVQTK